MPTSPSQCNWNSTGRTATRLDLSERHVRRLIASGDLKAITIGRVFRVSDEAIDEFARTHAVVPPPPPAAGVQLDLPGLDTDESANRHEEAGHTPENERLCRAFHATEDRYTAPHPNAVDCLEQ